MFAYYIIFPCIILLNNIILRSVKYRAVTRHITPLPAHIVQPGGSTMCLSLPRNPLPHILQLFSIIIGITSRIVF